MADKREELPSKPDTQRPSETATTTATATPLCPYLDTIQRSMLEFDFEPACSVTMETGPHIYGCLVCGKYFRGRGPDTAAYTHAVEESHFVFVHLLQGKFYCLPDDYEIRDPSLQDIKAALHPVYTREQIRAVDNNTTLSRDLFGRRYLPGFIGLHNLEKTDCVNAVVQALAHVPPLRNYFLQQTALSSSTPSRSLPSSSKSSSTSHKKKKRKTSAKSAASGSAGGGARHSSSQRIASSFGALVRKLWSDQRFKSHVDPMQLMQAITAASGNKYRIGHQAEAGEFMAWLLHQLHVGTGGTRKPGSSIIHRVFQGQVQVTTRKARQNMTKADIGGGEDDEDDRGGSDEEIMDVVADKEQATTATDDNAKQTEPEATAAATQDDDDNNVQETTTDTHFLQLTLDIPEKPLFRDDNGGLVIPQEPLQTVLKKFNGTTFAEAVDRQSSSGGGGAGAAVACKKRYQLVKLPDYLILHLARFHANRFSSREKNPTIVAFPVKNLDLSSYVFPPGGRKRPPTPEQVQAMSIKELKALLTRYGQKKLAARALEKKDLLEVALDFCSRTLPDLLADKYDLVANITHASPADVGREKGQRHDPLQEGSYKCHVQHRATQQWYEMQDLHVQEIMPQQIALSESYLLIFERKSAAAAAQVAAVASSAGT